MSTGLPRPGLTRSAAHSGRIRFLRGYVSKSSAALNPLTITQVARTSMRSALRGPAHQLAVRMRITHGHKKNSTMRQQLRVRRGFAQKDLRDKLSVASSWVCALVTTTLPHRVFPIDQDCPYTESAKCA